jgi:hypothetical protein
MIENPKIEENMINGGLKHSNDSGPKPGSMGGSSGKPNGDERIK